MGHEEHEHKIDSGKNQLSSLIRRINTISNNKSNFSIDYTVIHKHINGPVHGVRHRTCNIEYIMHVIVMCMRRTS